MNLLKLLHTGPDAEIDAAVWIDNHDRPRRVALFLAHHPVLHGAVLVLASPAIAVVATFWAVRELGRVINRVHEVRGEDGAMCAPCAKRDARALKGDEFTVGTFIGLCDLAELRGTEGGKWS